MYIGIDLGTTNSVITSFDGKSTRVWKSPEQNDVTPSVIYINKRGGKMYGQSAYNNEPRDPGNTAKLFKRLMGTSTKIRFERGEIEMSPEECSAEILRTLFGYLPEDVRNDPKTGTVITVPAAFNQMQRDATKQAAFMAGISKVALVQEPVAAIMSVAKQKDIQGTFVIYDLGGGTFDVSIAERVGSKINLITNDGIQLCGGRDFDRLLCDNIVIPWLYDKFNLPEDFRTNKKYTTLLKIAIAATEKAKIELSSKKEAIVSETETRSTDESGEEIYLDVPISRKQYEDLIFAKVDETIEKTRTVIAGQGLKPEDISNIVFVGGPTMYKLLRDKVAQALGIVANTDVNPMTAVSEGAAIYAESVDFESAKGGQKANKGTLKASEFDLEFRYTSRTSDSKAKIAVVFKNTDKLDFVFKSVDTGWTSGKMSLSNNSIVTVDLADLGENKFTVQCFDESGASVKIDDNTIIITKTLANIGKIPIAHSVGVEIEDLITKKPKMVWLIKKDDTLPKSGVTTFKTTVRISAGSSESLNIKLWEGEIDDPVDSNRLIGALKIDGSSFDYGIIPVGASVEFAYSFSDGGAVEATATVPSVGISETHAYDRLSGELDYNNPDQQEKIIEEAQDVLDKLDELSNNVFNEELERASKTLRETLDKSDELDAEEAQALFEAAHESKSVVAKYMRENKATVWQRELDEAIDEFESFREQAMSAQIRQVENLQENIQKAIDANSSTAEKLLEELHKVIAQAMFNNDDIFIAIFYSMQQSPQDFTNPMLYRQLISQGEQCLQKGDISGLKNVVARLAQIMIRREGSKTNDMLKRAGITQ